MPKKGGPVWTLWTPTASAPSSGRASRSWPSIAVAPDYVYWTANDAVLRAPRAGGVVTTFAGSQRDARFVAVGGELVYWATDAPHGAVFKAPASGGTPAIVAHDQASISALAADAGGVYWTTFGVRAGHGGNVVRAAAAGGEPVTLATGQKECMGIAVDSSRAYWSTTDRSEEARRKHADLSDIRAVPLRGGTVTTLASEQAIPITFAVDESSLYWVNQVTGNESSAWTVPGIMALRLR
jgi:hypothetical protein